ncbi:unnamed protein product [Auanema sp. JU1783]|nr:unnamed protein product [Auanema sp. JU1783]
MRSLFLKRKKRKGGTLEFLTNSTVTSATERRSFYDVEANHMHREFSFECEIIGYSVGPNTLNLTYCDGAVL